MPDTEWPNRIDSPSIDLTSFTFVDRVRPGVLTKMIYPTNHNLPGLAGRVPQENLQQGFKEAVSTRQNSCGSKIHDELNVVRYLAIAGTRLAQRALGSITCCDSDQPCPENTNLLTARGDVKFITGSTAKSLPVSRKLHGTDCPWDSPGGTSLSGCRQESPAIRRSADLVVPLQRCMGRRLTVIDLISKANKPGWRNGIDHPLERQTYEKGNVNQLIAGGRMPDCDC